MIKAIITPDNDAVVSEIAIAAPPERVFHALTTPDELGRWFTNSSCPVKFWEMDARPGGHYGYETQKGTVVVNDIDEFELSRRNSRDRPSASSGLHLDCELA